MLVSLGMLPLRFDATDFHTLMDKFFFVVPIFTISQSKNMPAVLMSNGVKMGGFMV